MPSIDDFKIDFSVERETSLPADIELITASINDVLEHLKSSQLKSRQISLEIEQQRNYVELLKKQLKSNGLEPCPCPPLGDKLSPASNGNGPIKSINNEIKLNPFMNHGGTSTKTPASPKNMNSPKDSVTGYAFAGGHRHNRSLSGGSTSVSVDGSSPVKDSEINRKWTNKRNSGISSMEIIDADGYGPLNFEEDSPMFTDTLKSMEETNEILDKKLKRIFKSAHLLVNNETTTSITAHVGGFASENSNVLSNFAHALSQLIEEGERDSYRSTITSESLSEGVEILGSHLGKVIQHLSESFSILLKNFQKNLTDPLSDFRKKVAELPALAHDYQSTQLNYEKEMRSFLLIKRKEKSDKIAEKEGELMGYRRDFELARFKYVRFMNELEIQKRTELMLTMQVSLAEFINFFASGNDLAKQYADASALLGKKLVSEKLNFVEIDRRWTMLRADVESAFSRGAFPVDAETRRKKAVAIFTTSNEFKGWKGVTHQGYLYKRSSSLVKDWKRRWFVMHGGVLYYYQEKGKKKSTAQQLRKFAKTIAVTMNEMERVCDMMLCSVKTLETSSDLRFTFEIISPGNRTYTLQAESEAEFNAWISHLRAEIENRLGTQGKNDRPSNQMASDPDKFIAMNRFVDTALYCADCNSENPDWAVINLGITVCINCSGVHRMMGTNISKVRSVALDEWRVPLLNLMCRIGNGVSNEVWFAERPSTCITSLSDRAEREKFIRSKYEKRLFINRLDKEDLVKCDPSFYDAAMNEDVELLLLLYANGANINFVNKETGKSVLHAAVETDSSICVEWLCQNGADVKGLTTSNQTPMDLAINDEIKGILKFHSEM